MTHSISFKAENFKADVLCIRCDKLTKNCDKANLRLRDFYEVCKALFDFKAVLRLASFSFPFSRNNSLSGNSHVTF